jgi:hypothetical protein
MARARTTRRSLVLSLLACLLLPSAGGGCLRVPSMTAESACGAVCGTPHMRELCLGTLVPGQGAGAPAVPVTRLAMAAVRGALGSYTATTAAATSLINGVSVRDGEKAAFGDCMVGYGSARVAMARVADDLAGGCDKVDRDLNADYTAGLRGMDMCSRGMLGYPASPLYAMNLADRNKTQLAALLGSLATPLAPGGRQ